MKADEPRQNRIPFMMSDSELSAVDEWRFSNRIGTRAEAIRRLCQLGLAADKAVPGIWHLVRTFTDREYLALMDMAKPEASADERSSVMREMEQDGDRARLILGTLLLFRTLLSYRSGESFDASLALAELADDEIKAELAYALSQLNGDQR
ncbi:hypothetical protein M2281_005786 [Mesorhizobium soli]|uniref:hypothetical protein n=1 Tax=Pseudaminobacter soli (ex Li et al. 2025) TaxID=1295366 RepID=UPI0024762C24|nr:hypothetical protein [Mesorhizobium soli]MDH6235164.1 hypothetical protein [Mesorhizobium soli]